MSALGDKLEGSAKELAGTLTGDDKTQAEGKSQQIVGNLKDQADDLKDAAGEKVNEVLDTIKDKTEDDR